MTADDVVGRLRCRSVLLGVVVDKVVFVASALLLASVVDVASPAFQALALGFGITATALGGFVAASHARGRFRAHGLTVGGIAFAISFGRFAVNGIWPPAEAAASHPLWWEAIGWAGALVAGALGGGLAAVRAAQSSSARSAP